MAILQLRAAVRINDRMAKTIDLTEQKLVYSLEPGGAISLVNQEGTVVALLSPGLWDCILPDAPTVQ